MDWEWRSGSDRSNTALLDGYGPAEFAFTADAYPYPDILGTVQMTMAMAEDVHDDGASYVGAASGDASCVGVAGSVCAGAAVEGGVERVA